MRSMGKETGKHEKHQTAHFPGQNSQVVELFGSELKTNNKKHIKKTHFDMRLEHCLHFLGAPPEDVDVP